MQQVPMRPTGFIPVLSTFSSSKAGTLIACRSVSHRQTLFAGKCHSFKGVPLPLHYCAGKPQPCNGPVLSNDSRHIEASASDSDNGLSEIDSDHDDEVHVPQDSVPDASCSENFLFSPTLMEYREQREAGLITSAVDPTRSEWSDAWALALTEGKAQELKNQYSRVGILIELNFSDFEPLSGCETAFNNATTEEIADAKAKAVYEATGLPAISEVHDMSIDAPESGSRINKTLQQGYYTRKVALEADIIINRVRPISEENRMTRFTSVVSYFDGEIEVRTSRVVNVAIVYSGSHYVTIATAAALDDMYKELTKRLGLTLESPGKKRISQEGEGAGDHGKILVGATLLKERILRDGKMLADSIIKVSSFLNHMVDTELMEMCGEELAERLRDTMPSKVLTVESTGLIAGLPTARKLGIPLVFARKSRPITISDSYQTTYRSATKGTTSELIVSCEYLEAGDRVLIIDDFLAGGSTAEALFKLAKMAHAKVVGVGVLIEKMSDGGRAFLSGYNVPVESLAKLLPAEDQGRIKFVEEEPWTPPNAKVNKQQVEEKVISAAAEYYSRGMVREQNSNAAQLKRYEESIEDDDTDSNSGVDVIRWQDDEEDLLDAMEDSLIRESGRS